MFFYLPLLNRNIVYNLSLSNLEENKVRKGKTTVFSLFSSLYFFSSFFLFIPSTERKNFLLDIKRRKSFFISFPLRFFFLSFVDYIPFLTSEKRRKWRRKKEKTMMNKMASRNMFHRLHSLTHSFSFIFSHSQSWKFPIEFERKVIFFFSFFFWLIFLWHKTHIVAIQFSSLSLSLPLIFPYEEWEREEVIKSLREKERKRKKEWKKTRGTELKQKILWWFHSSNRNDSHLKCNQNWRK